MLLGKPYYLKARHSKHQYETVAGDEDVAFDHEEEPNGHTSANEHHAIDDEEEEEVHIFDSLLCDVWFQSMHLEILTSCVPFV